MIQQIIFYGIGIFLIFLLYRIVKSQMKPETSCATCSGDCTGCMIKNSTSHKE
jgi:hypothetical protein